MAKTIATITGTALVPGVSRNGRWYKPEHVTEAVRKAQERIRAGDRPMVMLTFHGADDNSREIAATLTDMSLNENGGADFAAGFTDTDAGWNIARLADTSDGKPAHLKTVSIRGAWLGKVRKERAPGGQLAETADGVELEGIDFTKSPGVSGAEIKTFDWARDGATETTERVLITESVEEARVTITEDLPAGTPDGVREALRSLFGEAVSGGSTPPVHKRDSGLSDDTGRKYADPGYQADHKQRYDISSKAKARAAWSYVNQAANAKLYSGPQLKQVKKRIVAALRGFGVTVAAEGWSVDAPLLISEAIAEYAGMDPECAGSYSLSATNGPTTVTVCSYGLDPADLQLILAQACKAAGMALCALDPDMDADIDVPGADSEDTDGDVAPGAVLPDNGDGIDPLVARIVAAIKGESAEDPATLVAEAMAARNAAETAAPSDPAPDPAAATQEMEAPMPETPTTEAAGQVTAATSYSQADLDAAIARGIAQAEEARRARKAAKKAAAPAESAQPAGRAVTETDEQRIERIVTEKVAALVGPQETEEQKIARLVEERLTAERARLTESGHGPGRKGLAPGGAVTEHSGGRPAAEPGLNGHGFPPDWPDKPAHQFTDEERERYFGPALVRHTLGAKADLLA